jgi:hypothetical protein
VKYQASLFPSAVAFTAISVDDANRLLADWAHYLGPCRRPFGIEAWALELDGAPISVAVSASTVSATVGGLARTDAVELARLCSRPGARWATRPTLRLWREVAAPRWSYWPTIAAVAYSQNGRHDGSIYRFDGWTRVADDRGKGAGRTATWSKQRGADHPAEGRKTLWMWQYDTAASSKGRGTEAA